MSKELTILKNEINKKVVGQDHVVTALLIGLLTDSHILLEGMPGTAKTRSVKALSESLNCDFGRIQFTPDLLPSDVTGSESYHDNNGVPELKFEKGPIFNSIVLADEINRAPAKVQAALLEAMAEKTVTVSGETHTLPELFMVIATQNPIEQEGTYPLPEAQMDRFMMKVNVEYPSKEMEREVMKMVRNEEIKENIKELQNIEPEIIFNARKEINKVEVSEVIEDYILNLVMATREPTEELGVKNLIESGVSPRATIALDKCARAHAWLNDRNYTTPDDVRAIAESVLNHRIILSYEATGITPSDIINKILDNLPVG